MPGRNGTGPLGTGAITERGLGICAEGNMIKYAGNGFGLGCGRGFRKGYGQYFTADQANSKTLKELLQEQKDLLKNRLDVLDKQLENL